jgi:hypothetical protein
MHEFTMPFSIKYMDFDNCADSGKNAQRILRNNYTVLFYIMHKFNL